MATHSSILAWRTPWTEEPGGLQSIGLQRVGHNWVTSLTMLSASCEIPGWMKRKLELKIAGSNITNFRYTDDTSLRAKSEEELKSLLMSATMESQKAGLKLNIKKTKIMASSPRTSWKIDGGKLKTVTAFVFLGSKITVESDCSHKIKRCLLLRRNAMTKLDSIVKSRDITLPTKV